MPPEKFVIHVSGPICAGKSTFINAIGARFPGSYLIEYDKLKRQLFGYQRTREDHREIIRRFQWGLLELACEQSLPVITGVFLHDEEEYGRFMNITKRYGYEKRVFVRLTAPQDVLLERFRARVKHAKETGAWLSLDDESVFLSIISSPKRSLIPPGTPVFDTSVTNAEAIADDIARKLSA